MLFQTENQCIKGVKTPRSLRDEPLIIVGGSGKIEKKGSGSDSKKKKEATQPQRKKRGQTGGTGKKK